jgi:hypothetical protein
LVSSIFIYLLNFPTISKIFLHKFNIQKRWFSKKWISGKFVLMRFESWSFNGSILTSCQTTQWIWLNKKTPTFQKVSETKSNWGKKKYTQNSCEKQVFAPNNIFTMCNIYFD